MVESDQKTMVEEEKPLKVIVAAVPFNSPLSAASGYVAFLCVFRL
jgi:acyl-CoA reductase-like NAD-dependent aldehyde dehydrogenase